MTAVWIGIGWTTAAVLVAAGYHLTKQRFLRSAATARSFCPCGTCGQ